MAEFKFVGYSEYYLLFVVFKMKWKKKHSETQTLCVGCSKAEPQISARHRPNKHTHPHTQTDRTDYNTLCHS